MGKKKKTTKKEKSTNKKANVILEKIKPIKAKFKKIYIGYIGRVGICVSAFVILFSLSLLFFSKTFDIEEAKVVRYQETGTLDYKVYLKENEFYETPYLDKNMVYIASLINYINVDLNYQFIIDNTSDMTFTYDVVGNLVISGNQGKNVLYQKEYILKSGDVKSVEDMSIYNFKDNLKIDYDYYNAQANKFKATYGVDATSELEVFVRVNKKVNNELYQINLNETKQMSMIVPLTQKTLEISSNGANINNSNSIVKESKTKVGNVVCGVLCFTLFVGAVAALLKTLELLIVLKPKVSKYDKYIKKILTEYDRLIVETPTEPRLENKEIVKIKKFEELLDARDNLKRPIMYHNLIDHQKCYFYIEKENTMYFMTIKATDVENDSVEKK